MITLSTNDYPFDLLGQLSLIAFFLLDDVIVAVGPLISPMLSIFQLLLLRALLQRELGIRHDDVEFSLATAAIIVVDIPLRF